ncbi:MAG: GNAT family N-acetyltransferase [Bacteroidales bacterium]|jgi:ribosomal protein S18 acetylase RimI-like enzyme|nr:GNAT family N-acetyltransferase [Bacteroidales bacterium]
MVKKKITIFYCIHHNNELIGFVDFYLEYQRKDIAYLCSIYIKEEYRKYNFGKEVINELIGIFVSMKFKKIHLHCSIRNTMALKFWVKLGFNNIVNIESKGNLLDGNFGGIEFVPPTLNLHI